jgi:adenylate cyclase class 1
VTKQYAPIKLGSPGEDISKKDLQAVKHRFKTLHQFRVHQVQEFLQPRQRLFLELLPLLFHRNIPVLPGFISLETPSGIPEYSPSSKTIKAAKKIAKNFTYGRRLSRKGAIEGLFLMGSAGSIAFSRTSDMDIWLCHQSDLSFDQAIELQQKATAIESWAASLDLEVHFFLMDSKRFLSGQDTPMSKESSGKTQHYLLLEEFYRTAVYLAGKSPAWWLVPPHQDENYTNYINHLKSNRFVHEQELIDFGGLELVPAEEFISATLWHIYKSLSSPHKSLLKLLLMECYASEYPQPQWLCQTIKQAIYQGDFATRDLDPYFLIYQKVDAYLQKIQNSQRLSLVRECFYLKIMGSTDNTMANQSRAAREAYLQTIAEQWQWPAFTLTNLKKQRFWTIKKATEEHGVILHQLSHCFRMILGFANNYVDKQNYQGNSDQKLIGRKLYSFLEKKPGKVEIITTRNAVHAKENELTIVEKSFANDVKGWMLVAKKAQENGINDPEPIHKSWSLMEMLCWLVVNGLYQKHLRIHLHAVSCFPSSDELQSVLNSLDGFFSNYYTDDGSLDVYQTANLALHSLVVINFGLISNELREDGMCVISERSDALSYGVNRQCFIQTIDKVTVSSWGEITVSHFEGIEGLFDCLLNMINYNRKPVTERDLVIACHTLLRAKSIILRIKSLFGALIRLFSKPQPRTRLPRYIVAGENMFYVFGVTNKVLGFKALLSADAILKELGSSQACFSQVYFDQAVLENTPIPLIYSNNKANVVQIFYFRQKSHITVYILDERGSFYTRQHEKSDPEQLLFQYSLFLQAIINRNQFDKAIALEYYEIQKNSAGVLSCNQVYLKVPASSNQLSLRISGVISAAGINYTIYCNEDEFSSMDYGNQLFVVVYNHILQCRKSKQDYPIYISDIDLPFTAFRVESTTQLQSVHYLNYKQKIEAKLNV